MKNYLRELFEGEYTPSAAFHPLSKEGDAIMEQISAFLGRESMDTLFMAHGEAIQAENYDWFREGFRLGAALMLEVLHN